MDLTPMVVPGVIALMGVFAVVLFTVTVLTHERK
jgi:hypothetical protein